jgi:hypothetical protein
LRLNRKNLVGFHLLAKTNQERQKQPILSVPGSVTFVKIILFCTAIIVSTKYEFQLRTMLNFKITNRSDIPNLTKNEDTIIKNIPFSFSIIDIKKTVIYRNKLV